MDVTLARSARPAITWRRIARDAACLAGLVWFAYGVLAFREEPLIDARMYWSVKTADPYAGFVWGGFGFSYSPPLAQAFAVLHVIPWPLFAGLWTVLTLGLLAWLLRPAPWVGLVLAYPIFDSLRTGQIELVMTAAIVVGFRTPGLWALPILAKITPGVGLLWFAVRREWQALAIALGATAAIVVLSVATVPDWWVSWFGFLTERTGGAQQWFWIRAAIAVGLAGWGARTGRAWTVPVTAMLALPVVYVHSLAMLAGGVRLRASYEYQPAPYRVASRSK